jgi:hypothetical protein
MSTADACKQDAVNIPPDGTSAGQYLLSGLRAAKFSQILWTI